MLFLIFFIVISFLPICAGIYFRLTNGKCRSNTRLDGKTVLITGGTAGIGYEYLLDIAKRGAKIIIACRNVQKGMRSAKKIVQLTGNENIRVEQCDLASFESVRNCCHRLKAEVSCIDVFCCFAASVGDSVMDRPTEDGYELQFQCNYLSHLLMICLLFDCFIISPDCRIIMTSSAAYLIGTVMSIDEYGTFPAKRTPFQLYADSKLALIMITKQLSYLLNKGKYSNVTINAFHPGTVHTDGIKSTRFLPLKYFLVLLSWIYGKSPQDGAQTMLHLTVCDGVRGISGIFWADCLPVPVGNWQANNEELCRLLWRRSALLLQPFVDRDIHSIFFSSLGD